MFQTLAHVNTGLPFWLLHFNELSFVKRALVDGVTDLR